ncbi:MAG: hypothetical protein KKD68_04540, partial [Proteobacteria bacterium]|nr:hypothetical protein [Pseudomonadota bacterium]
GYKFEILNFLLLYPTILLIPCQSKKIEEVFNIASCQGLLLSRKIDIELPKSFPSLDGRGLRGG